LNILLNKIIFLAWS